MQLLSDLTIPDKSFAYFNLTVTDNMMSRGDNGVAHIAINAYATSFGSDPDIFVSKTSHVTTVDDATWYSMKEGSDSCIISSGNYAIGDTFLITIKCMNECSFDLRTYYAQEYELIEEERMTFRWGGHVTNILKYFVPSVTAVGDTRKFQIDFEVEGDYNFMEVYLSIAKDDNFSVVQDRPATHTTDKGLSMLMEQSDPSWCTNCYVYLIVNVVQDRRVYVTPRAMSGNPGLREGVNNRMLVNEGSIGCTSYSISSSTVDSLFLLSNYQGTADFFLSGRTQPSSITSSSVSLRSIRKYPHQALLATSIDRNLWGSPMGIHYICAQAYDSVSTQIVVLEGIWNRRITAQFEMLYNFMMDKGQTQQFMVQDSELFSSTTFITIEATVHTTKDGDQSELLIYYKVCKEAGIDCFMTDEEALGNGDVKKLEFDEAYQSTLSEDEDLQEVEQNILHIGFILHDSSECKGLEVCQYIFSVVNPSPQTGMRQISFLAGIKTHAIQDIVPGQSYINKVGMEKCIYYRIVDQNYDTDSIYQLKLDLMTYLGDADLFVSTNETFMFPCAENYNFASRHKDYFDQIVMKDTVNDWLPKYIYIAVYGELYSEFELSVVAEYHPTVNEKLSQALPLKENYSVQQVFETELDSAFYSYSPWWSNHENKQIVMLADSTLKEVRFYVELDDYPLSYLTEWHDEHEMFALQPFEERFMTGEGKFGTYYVKVRPDYDLADFLKMDPYSYYFRAFSQPAGDNQTDLYQDMNIPGIARQGQNAFYRHFITDRTQTIKVTLKRLYGKGLPILMLKYSNQRVKPNLGEPTTFDAKLQLTKTSTEVSFEMSSFWRATEGHPDCDYAGYWADGGNELCTLYMAVECLQDEEMCAFRIQLELIDEEEVGKKLLPPRYIPNDQDYTDVDLVYGLHQRFYYPVQLNSTGDVLVLANSTAPIGVAGNMTLLLNLEKNASQDFRVWKQAWSVDGHHIVKKTQTHPAQPLTIPIEEYILNAACQDDQDCVLTISVLGETENNDSIARLRVFTGWNKLLPLKPAQGKLAGKGSFQYFWFYQEALSDPQQFWQHSVALGIVTPGADFDLYVTVMDGRYPTEDDYDFKSTNFGADSIYLSSRDPMLSNSTPDSWNTEQGVVVVIGVKSLQEEEAEYTVVVTGSDEFSFNITELETNQALLQGVPVNANRSDSQPYVKIYKWFNWGHGNFQMEVKALRGHAKFYLNTIGENSYLGNAFTTIGLDEAGSVWSADLVSGNDTLAEEAFYVMEKKNTTQREFCYGCWYYLTVVVDTVEDAEYRIWFQRLNDRGIDIWEIQPNFSNSFELFEEGDTSEVKFILNSNDAFSLDIDLSQGEIVVKMGMDPDTFEDAPMWTLTQTQGKQSIEVAKDNPRSHIGTWYYVSIENVRSDAAIGTVYLRRLYNVQLIADGVPRKLQFDFEQQLVMLAAFAIPSSDSSTQLTEIQVESISEHFYPTLYLKKIESQKRIDRLEDLDYPSVVDNDIKFGDDLHVVGRKDKSIYGLTTETQATFYTYYTMAIYKNTYGMTDERKPEFKLTVTSVEVQQSEVVAEQEGEQLAVQMALTQ